MHKQLLLAVVLGGLTFSPAPAWADGHGPVYPKVESSFGIRVIVRDGPRVVHHHDRGKRHLRSQPWPRHFSHHAPRWRWQERGHHRPRQFHWRDRDHRPWFRTPGAQHFRHGHAKHWKHGDAQGWSRAPWRQGRHRSDGHHD
jgi:hypothetical protein